MRARANVPLLHICMPLLSFETIKSKLQVNKTKTWALQIHLFQKIVCALQAHEFSTIVMSFDFINSMCPLVRWLNVQFHMCWQMSTNVPTCFKQKIVSQLEEKISMLCPWWSSKAAWCTNNIANAKENKQTQSVGQSLRNISTNCSTPSKICDIHDFNMMHEFASSSLCKSVVSTQKCPSLTSESTAAMSKSFQVVDKWAVF